MKYRLPSTDHSINTTCVCIWCLSGTHKNGMDVHQSSGWTSRPRTPCASREGVFVTHIIEAFWEEQDGPPKPVPKWLKRRGMETYVKGGAGRRAPAGRPAGACLVSLSQQGPRQSTQLSCQLAQMGDTRGGGKWGLKRCQRPNTKRWSQILYDSITPFRISGWRVGHCVFPHREQSGSLCHLHISHG